MHAQMVVLQLPPRLSLRSLVSLESRNGTKLRAFADASAETQLDSAAMDLLMVLAS